MNRWVSLGKQQPADIGLVGFTCGRVSLTDFFLVPFSERPENLSKARHTERGLLVIPALGRSGTEAGGQVMSPRVLSSLARSHLFKEVQCACQNSSALGLQNLLLSVDPKE